MIKNLLFDFDGVIMDSLPLKNRAFEESLKEHDDESVKQLIEYHTANGGLSRYHKFRYFYENIIKTAVTDEKLAEHAAVFSEFVKNNIINPDLLITDSLDFIRSNHNNYDIHVVSGSDEQELQFICRELNIDNLFVSINGSPTPKTQLIDSLMFKHGYNKSDTVMIGDSINDYTAAKDNGLEFFGYNNPELFEYSKIYIERFEGFCF